jgi:uncharacterized protein YpuA (DUF1002 family)
LRRCVVNKEKEGNTDLMSMLKQISPGGDELAKAVFLAAMENIKESQKTVSQQVTEIVNVLKDQVNNLESELAHTVKLEIARLEHQRELPKVQAQVAKDMFEVQTDLMRTLQAYEVNRAKYHLYNQTGLLGFKTKSKKIMAAMLAKSDLSQLMQNMNTQNMFQTLPALPAPSGDGDSGGSGGSKTGFLKKLVELLDEE